ncbi:DUF6625 family protein [Methylobacillus flagellatus]|uniref:Glycosyltransferase n=1 Tax=Methylobacillus flagellatus (strain ATCC 51484 / DSM 6875 / VKM B-1610 / KT) TaxID=265072 RepID=Q1H3A4_METFK|nr:DUF6625 family protein [Methylobacillus flagellatus]ABE49033.1 conserved hypothetical protein [Methylobacillus flagellatus KT]
MQKERSSICILIPYFGNWPFWISLFLHGCRANPTVNWIIYTDCDLPENCPKNVQIRHVTYQNYCCCISESLGIEFAPKSPYKLCDIKPALGYIHSEEIKSYDFWGFGDLDLIYGDLRAYFSCHRLQSKDLFSTTGRRVSGHLCLMRNIEEMRTAFMRVEGWKQIFSSNQHVAFDEKHFSKIFLRHKNSPFFVRWIAAKFDSWLTRGEFNEAYVTPNAGIPWIDGTYDFPTEWYWKDGVVTNNLTGDREFPYFHFMIWKNKWSKSNTLSMLDLNNMQDRVIVTESGITVV